MRRAIVMSTCFSLLIGCGTQTAGGDTDEVTSGTFEMWNIVNPKADTPLVSAFDGVRYVIDASAHTFTVLEPGEAEHRVAMVLAEETEWFRGCYLNGPEHAETFAYTLDIDVLDMGPMILNNPFLSGGCGGGRPFLWDGSDSAVGRTEYTLE